MLQELLSAVQYCQKRSSPVCMVMNKLAPHPPVFILTPSRRSTPICIYHPNQIPSSYIIDYMTYYCFRMPLFLSNTIHMLAIKSLSVFNTLPTYAMSELYEYDNLGYLRNRIRTHDISSYKIEDRAPSDSPTNSGSLIPFFL
jgi:hypothetical protein